MKGHHPEKREDNNVGKGKGHRPEKRDKKRDDDDMGKGKGRGKGDLDKRQSPFQGTGAREQDGFDRDITLDRPAQGWGVKQVGLGAFESSGKEGGTRPNPEETEQRPMLVRDVREFEEATKVDLGANPKPKL